MNLFGYTFLQRYIHRLSRFAQTKNEWGTLVVTPNPEMLYDASRDAELLEVLKDASLALPDGAGIFVTYQITESILLFSQIYSISICGVYKAVIHNSSFVEKYGERITGSRLTRDLIAYAAEMKIPVTIIDPVVTGDSEWDRAKEGSQEKCNQHSSQISMNYLLNHY